VHTKLTCLGILNNHQSLFLYSIVWLNGKYIFSIYLNHSYHAHCFLVEIFIKYKHNKSETSLNRIGYTEEDIGQHVYSVYYFSPFRFLEKSWNYSFEWKREGFMEIIHWILEKNDDVAFLLSIPHVLVGASRWCNTCNLWCQFHSLILYTVV
jgi:hypothetical protein